MTKKQIVKQISEEVGAPQVKTKEIVQKTFDAIVDTLVTHGRIELRNFGVFEVKWRKPRRARNPRTNEPVVVEAKRVVTFQPGKVMEERVRTMDAAGIRREVTDDDADLLDRDADADADTDEAAAPVPVGAAVGPPPADALVGGPAGPDC